MSYIKYTTEGKKHKHLTERERYQIEILLKENLKPLEIAKRLPPRGRARVGKGLRSSSSGVLPFPPRGRTQCRQAILT